ncbi:MAG: ribonuclease P protein component [Candidatus Paceibacterota bacterium]
MLPKTQRINTQRFGEIMASGRNINAGGFYLKTLNNDSLRFAVAIPKKVVKSAIKRHLLKRRIFNIIKENKDLFPVADYIVFTNKEALDLNRVQMEEAIKIAAQKV